ncbi:MAG: DUF6249 domain-containing protein [Prolixibacteraceae bacterium]
MVEIIVPVAVFTMIFGIVYVIVTAFNRERMAMIEKGADPKFFESLKTSSKTRALKWGLVLVGVGLGLFLAGICVSAGMDEGAAYPGLICLFGGAGLLLAYRIEQKSTPPKEME